MSKKCPKCQKEVYPEDLFCGNCGFNLSVQEHKVVGTQVDLKLSDIRFNLGMVYLKKGEYAKAIDTFEKILKEEPDNLQIMEMLKQAREALNNVMSAS